MLIPSSPVTLLKLSVKFNTVPLEFVSKRWVQDYTVWKTLAIKPHILSSYRVKTFSCGARASYWKNQHWKKSVKTVLSSSLPFCHRDIGVLWVNHTHCKFQHLWKKRASVLWTVKGNKKIARKTLLFTDPPKGMM